MTISLQNIFAYALIFSGLVFVLIPHFGTVSVVLLSLGFILAYREHQKNKR